MFIKILIVEKNPGKLRSKAVSFKREKAQPTPPPPNKVIDNMISTCMSSIAQLVECQTLNPGIEGSKQTQNHFFIELNRQIKFSLRMLNCKVKKKIICLKIIINYLISEKKKQKNVRMSIRKPSKQSASKSDHFEFFTYVYRRKNTQKSKLKKNANK